jgi:hypothetical protein
MSDLNSNSNYYCTEENRNINFVIIKNISEDETIDLYNYLKLLKNDIHVSNLGNKNLNIIFIENIECFEDKEPIVTIDNNPVKSGEIITQDDNSNINFITIKNIIGTSK